MLLFVERTLMCKQALLMRKLAVFNKASCFSIAAPRRARSTRASIPQNACRKLLHICHTSCRDRATTWRLVCVIYLLHWPTGGVAPDRGSTVCRPSHTWQRICRPCGEQPAPWQPEADVHVQTVRRAVSCRSASALTYSCSVQIMLAHAPGVAYTTFLCVFSVLAWIPIAALRAKMGPLALLVNLGFAFTSELNK